MLGRVVRKEAKQNAVHLSLGHVLDNPFQLLGIPAVARLAAPRLPALLHGSCKPRSYTASCMTVK